jgi:N,N'-diacetyllegionaminate synthase
MINWINIANYKIGYQQPCFIIAEIGVNHNGSQSLAYQLIDAAVQAGVDAVKFQSFKTDQLVTPNAPKAEYQLQNTGTSESQYEMLKRLELSAKAHRDLMAYCQEKGVIFLSTPFDKESADLLDDLGIAAFKIPSGEITNLPFLRHIALKGRPMIVSTGMAYLGEVETAVRTIKEIGNSTLALLHCVSNYPANPSDVNLRAMHTMSTAFDLPVGYSDHTRGIEVALAAVALGACVIEKHVTLDRNLPGPDHQASIEPDELIEMVRAIRIVESSLGHGRKEPSNNESNTATVARRSLVANTDLSPGMMLTEELVAIKRPGTGLPPSMLSHFLGRTVKAEIAAGTLLTWEMLA